MIGSFPFTVGRAAGRRRGGGARRGRWIPVALCVVTVAAGCSGPSLDEGSATALPAVSSPSVSWTECGEGAECARVPVPLDWDRPDGEAIELAVARHRASRPEERIGTLFVSPGGPGESGVELVAGSGADLDAWGAGRFDVVGWDPRGTNGSSPVRCFATDAEEDAFWQGVTLPGTQAESDAYAATVADLARRCAEVSGDLLAHITTADSARDLDVLRELVGDSQLTHVGLSYGTLLGQTYANLFPDRVRAMFLDGIVDATAYSASAETRTANSVSSFDEVFDQFLARCEQVGPARCAFATEAETTTERFERLFAEVRRSGVPALHLDPPGILTNGDLQRALFAPLRDAARWPALAEDLDAAADGDASLLLDAARRAVTPAAFAQATTSAAIQCADAPAEDPVSAWPQEIDSLAGLSRLVGPLLGWWLWAPCSAWEVRGADSYRGPWNASTVTPILLVGTTHDPSTAYRNAEVAEETLGNAVLLTHEGYGHLSIQDPSRCIDEARVRYLVDLVTPRPGTVCAADDRPFD